MSGDSVVAFAWDVFKIYLVVPIERRFRYVISSERFANGLREEVQNLEKKAERVHKAAEVARNNLRNFHREFTEWEARAEEALKEAADLLGDFEKASKNCCYGTLPNPKCRYRFSRKAEGKIEVIKQLAQECSGFKELKDICSSPPAPGNVAAPNPGRREGKDVVQSTTATASVFSASTSLNLGDDGVFESRALMIRNIMDVLANDSNSVVGVHGMGGVGKSTLLEDAEKRIREKKSFDWVAKADVSQNPDIKNIQGEIADALGLSDIKNKESVSGRAELLHRRLKEEESKKKKVLIILDNLWKGLDLKSVGIPCGPDNKVMGCKLLLTSRDRYVLRREMCCDKDFHLGELEDEEAKRLFERLVGGKVHDEEFKPLVDEALPKCRGLPFLIVNMAKHFKHAGSSEWKNALKQIKLSKNEGLGELINNMLQLSYDHLKDAEKSLLALCVAYGTSHPSLENLVRYGVGWGLFREDDNVEEARESLRSGIRTLQASSLLLEDGDGYGFKIHDLVREFVAMVASRDHPLLVLKDKDKSITELPKDKLRNCRAVCFPYVDMKELPQELYCPELQIFLLFTNNESLQVPDSLFYSMRKLMVLHLTGIRLTCSPSPFQFLENLQTLCLNGSSLDDVAILGELKGLQILSFANSKIQRLPKEIGQLVELRLLDLNYCSELQIIEPGVLRNLIKLEELYMEASFHQWSAVEQTPPTNASLIELNHMKNLRTLNVSIPNPSVLPEDLNVEKLTNYNIRIGNARRYSKYKGSRTLELKLDPISDVLRQGCIQSILDKTDDLFLDGLNETEQSICALSRGGFPELKHLQVQNSPSVHHILWRPSLAAFKTLEWLRLNNLINLEKISNNNIPSESFSALKVVRVESCHKMEVLFPLSVVRELSKLEEIKVGGCKLMRGIVEADDRGKFELPKLRVLTMRDLPNIKNFSTAGLAPSSSTSDDQVGTQIAFFHGQQVSIPSLESLTMEGLPNLKEIWSDEFPLGQSNLQSLNVWGCKSLSKVFSSRSVVKLHKLHTLSIRNCVSVQEIFDLNGPSASGNVETLSQLTTLQLNELPSLRRIWNKSPCGIVSFHNLKGLKVHDCDNLEFLFFPSMVKSLAQLRDLSISNCKKMEAIITEEEGLGMETSETSTFPILTNLSLKRLKSLTCFSRGKRSQEAQCQDRIQSRSTALFNGEVAFPRLETVDVTSLDKLGFIFFPSMVKSLAQLKKLSVRYCEKMEAIVTEEEGLGMETSETLAFPMLTNLCLNRLRSLTCFSCGKCSREARSQDRIQSCSTALFNQEVAFPSLVTLYIGGMDNIEMIWDNQVAADSFPKLKSLCVDGCNKFVTVVPSFILGRLLNLESLKVEACDSLEVVFDLQPLNLVGHPVALPLKELTISGLPKLKCVWDKELHRQVKFQCLSFVRVSNCKSLISLFPASIAKDLMQLKQLKIDVCGISKIIEKEEGPVPRFVFQNLNSLELKHLTKLKCLYTGTHTSYWPALKTLKVDGCNKVEILASQTENEMPRHKQPLFLIEKVAFPSLETLDITGLDNIEMIWDNQVAADSFPKLKSICVDACHKLVTVVPSFILGRLLCLESLDAKRCGLLEVVFKLQPLNPLDGHPIALPLNKLTVSELPKLKSVWDKELHHQVKFQCLRSVRVSECKSLTSLIPASVAKDLIQLEELKINKCGIVELIETEGLVARFDFPKLTSLKLEHLTELKCIYSGTHALHWPELKTLKVHGCNKVEILACQIENEMPLNKQPLFLIEKGAFPNLQELKLDLGNRMETWHGHFHDEEFFCKLRVLELRHLSKEYAVSTCHFVESLTNLEELVVCESYLEEPTSNVEAIESPSQELKVILPLSRYIQHLRTLNVSYCDGLSSMFTPTIAGNLVALIELKISNCRMLTEVISDEGSKEGHVVAFNHLKCMELDGLIRLRCFSSGGYTLKFPLLEDVIVTRCPNMKFFSEEPIEASKLERVKVSTKAWFWKGDLNITIQNMFEEMGVEFMWLSKFPELIGKWHGELNPIKSSWRLKSLVVDKCPSFVNAITSKLILVLDNMSTLNVRDCESLEEIFDLEGLDTVESTRVLPSFETLGLVNLPKLRRLWNKDLQGMMRFDSLTSLTIYKCSNLRHAFTPSMARCLANLLIIEIKECSQMEGVIAADEGQGSGVETITFPKLIWIELECLPSLTGFLTRKDHMLECPQLKYLTIAHCPRMRSLTGESWMENGNGTLSLFTPQVQFRHLAYMVLSHMDNLSKLWTDGPQETLVFYYLQEVEVQNCKSLVNLFPHWVATNLTQFEKLRVESCGIEEIVTSGDDTPHSIVVPVLFPKLTSLVLHDMPQLKSFCTNLPTLKWPFLKELRVTHCEKVKMLSFAASMNKWTHRDNQQDLSDQEAHSTFERDFPNLKRLLLVDKDIQMIQDEKFPKDIFVEPEALTLACFHDEKAVFPLNFLLERFQNLQSLEVFCSSFEAIFPDEGLVDEEKHSVLENLRELKLSKLHNLNNVWRGDYLEAKILRSIKTFEVWDCPCLTTIFPTATSFRNLMKLVVKDSSGFEHLVTVSTVTNLTHLTDMTIIGCERMKEVVANDGNREGNVISLGKLTSLKLQNLPSLECFSSITSCSFSFPSLRDITVEECPKMKIFSKGTLSTPRLTIVRLFKYSWNLREGDLNGAVQKLSAA